MVSGVSLIQDTLFGNYSLQQLQKISTYRCGLAWQVGQAVTSATCHTWLQQKNLVLQTNKALCQNSLYNQQNL